MVEGGKISGRQAVFVLIMTIVPTSILFLPHMIYVGAKQDSWLSVILITFFGLAAGEIIGRLGKRFPGRTVIEYSRELVGPFLGRAVGLLYAGFFIYINAFIVREFAEMLTTNFYEETPVAVFMIGIILVAIYVIRHGLEVLSRVNDTVFPLMLVMLGSLILFIIPTAKTENLLPVLENGITPVIKGAIPAGVFFAETSVMLMLTPYLARPAEVRSVIAKAILSVGALQLIVALAVTSVIGAQTAYLLFPTLNVARLVRPARFLTNVDPFILVLWLMGGFTKIAVFHYCATLATAKLLKLSNYGVVSIVNGIILGVLSIILWEDVVELAHQISHVVPPYFLSIQVGIPMLLLVTAVIRRRGTFKNAGK